MDSWDDILDRALLPIEELKAALPLQYVANQAGVALSPSGERLIGLCPFHEEENPSFALWGENLEVAGCWSCDFRQGDVLDFIGRYWGKDLAGSREMAQEFLTGYKADTDWEPLRPEVEVTRMDSAAALQVVRDAWSQADQNQALIEQFTINKNLHTLPGTWIHEEWRVGVNADQLVIPHFEAEGVLTGYKTRYLDGHPYAVKGSKFPSLYGAWRGIEDKVIVCEGESDAWWVSWLYRERPVSVVALPTGAGAPCRAEWQEALEGRHVILFFDGDGAGRGASRNWAKSLISKTASLRVVTMREDYDACKLLDHQVYDAVGSSVEIKPWDPALIASKKGYLRESNQAPVCDFTLKPLKWLNIPDGWAAHCLMSGRMVTITDQDLSSPRSMTSWSGRNEAVWLGTQKDVQHLAKMLLEEKPFLPQGYGTYQLGWHDDSFVLPDRTLGPSDYTHIRGDVTGEYESFITFDHPVGNPGAVLAAMCGLHRSDVVKPLMAWTAVALMRDLFREFPTLVVVGASGAGKTTLLDAVLGGFGFGGGEHNLTTTTRYGLALLVGTSTGVPVWIDEYRRQATRDARAAMQQTVRDAWTQGSSVRGGVDKTDYSKVVAMKASGPLIVSGEDIFTETSLRERMQLVRVPKKDSPYKNPVALKALKQKGQMGEAYLNWLIGIMQEQKIPDFTGMERKALGRAVMEYGWQMLRRFGLEVGGIDIGEYEQQDESDVGVVEEDPVIEALLWAIGKYDRDAMSLFWYEAEWDAWCIRPLEFTKAAAAVGYELPGGNRAVLDLLLEQYGDGGKKRHKIHGRCHLFKDTEALNELIGGSE